MTYTEIKNVFGELNLPLDKCVIEKIIDDIALNKQFTQKDMRLIKNSCPGKISAVFRILLDIKKRTPDLIVVTDEESIDF